MSIGKLHYFKIIFSFIVLFNFSSCLKDTNETLKESSGAEISDETINKLPNKIRVKTTKGDFIMEFFSDVSPGTTKRIKHLFYQKFYHGIKFHRVIPTTLVQIGDPTGLGNGGSGKTIKAEFNKIRHERGIVSMARLGNDIHSADSQFFICLQNLNHLDEQYTIFAKVISGMEILDKIEVGDKIISTFFE